MPAATLFRSTFTLARADLPQLPPLMQERLCASDQPLVLLPVRLETRFFAQPDGSSELRVRIYPDKIHLDSHEPELTRTELEWGTHGWEMLWRAGNDAEAQKSAWRQLADRFGDARAAWILRALEPTNDAQRPTAPTASDKPLPVAPKLRSATVVDDAEQASWRRAPCAQLMPDHWIAIVQSGGRPVLAARGRDVVQPVAVGPDPQATPTGTGEETLVIDPGMLWMVDFDVAEAKGMALRIPIPAATLAAGLDSLFVFGVSASASPSATADAFADLLDAHHYTDGLEFMHVGHADEQHCRSPRRLPERRSRSRRELCDRSRERSGRARRQRERASTGSGTGPCTRTPAAHAWACRARRGDARWPATQHERRAVAGELGILPHQYDRRRTARA